MTLPAARGSARSARLVTSGSAGVLLGLYDCREDDHDDKVLTHAGTPDAVDDLARTVFEALGRARVRLPGLSDECPEWADWYDRA
jgi:hypothetical protein